MLETVQLLVLRTLPRS